MGGASDATIYDLSGNGNNAAFTSTGYSKSTDNGGSIVLAADTQNSRFDLASAVTFTNTEDFTFLFAINIHLRQTVGKCLQVIMTLITLLEEITTAISVCKTEVITT